MTDLERRVRGLMNALFTSGSGDQADRLILMRDTEPPRDLGGWCRAAAEKRIIEALREVAAEARAEERERCEAALRKLDFAHGTAQCIAAIRKGEER